MQVTLFNALGFLKSQAPSLDEDLGDLEQAHSLALAKGC